MSTEPEAIGEQQQQLSRYSRSSNGLAISYCCADRPSSPPYSARHTISLGQPAWPGSNAYSCLRPVCETMENCGSGAGTQGNDSRELRGFVHFVEQGRKTKVENARISLYQRRIIALLRVEESCESLNNERPPPDRGYTDLPLLETRVS